MSIGTYRRKRDFRRTPEPRGKTGRPRSGHRFVIHKHAATRLHYDLRLELDGVLKSWAVPKGPSPDPGQKRLAIQVEDHPVEYGTFEGTIPKGEYGGGEVILWDRGTWTSRGNARAGLEKGHLDFELHGEKLHGGWRLLRMGRRGEEKPQWLLIKESDDTARPGHDVLEERPASVKSGRTIEDLKRGTRAKAQPSRVSSNGRPRRAAAPPARSRRKLTAAGELPGARAARLPAHFAPELATLVSEAPGGDEWLHEIKYDGYRVI